MSAPLLEVEGLTVHHGQLCAIRDVSLEVSAGEVLAIIGANGAGKSTLLRTLAGLHHPTSGAIRLDGQDIAGSRPDQRLAAGLALVPEGRRLFRSLTVEDNLRVGTHRARKGPYGIDAVYEIFPWMRDRRRQLAGQLSGGEQQAVAIGRALVANPRVLLLDELSLGLSPLAAQRIYGVMPELLASGMTVLLVEQDLGLAMKVATRVQCLLEGRVVLEGDAGTLDRAAIEAAYFGVTAGTRGSGPGTG
ncbi:MAG TPA: ABC transporter ATP-binding protein [Acidimicrobiales bacterium]|nr:ABC transporter ATP-binding protein [Acidimicrobiales bacterium]